MATVFNRVGGGSGGEYPSVLFTSDSFTSSGSVVMTGQGKNYNGVWNSTGFIISKVDDYGTYTYTAVQDSQTKTGTVLIDAVEDYEVSIEFVHYLYNLGNECTTITGGWDRYPNKDRGFDYNDIGVITKNSDNITSTLTGGQWQGSIGTVNTISLAGYNTLYCETLDISGANAGWIGCSITTRKAWLEDTSDLILIDKTWRASGRTTHSLDISNLNETYYIDILSYDRTYSMYKLWLE